MGPWLGQAHANSFPEPGTAGEVQVKNKLTPTGIEVPSLWDWSRHQTKQLHQRHNCGLQLSACYFAKETSSSKGRHKVPATSQTKKWNWKADKLFWFQLKAFLQGRMDIITAETTSSSIKPKSLIYKQFQGIFFNSHQRFFKIKELKTRWLIDT